MKANEQAAVAGRRRRSGCVIVISETAISSGRIVFAVAVFDVSWVSSPTTVVIATTCGSGARLVTVAASAEPTTVVSPLAWQPPARAKPPPINTSTPHGRCCCATAHVSSASPGRFFDGIRKMSTAAAHAVAASPPDATVGPTSGSIRYGRVTHMKI